MCVYFYCLKIFDDYKQDYGKTHASSTETLEIQSISDKHIRRLSKKRGKFHYLEVEAFCNESSC